MRCRSCNSILTDKEATRKSLITRDYLDICDTCLAPIQEDLVFSLSPEDDFWGDPEEEAGADDTDI